MPYIFIWAGYIFRNLESKDKFGHTITHVTQGAIEKHFGTTKLKNGHVGLYPAEYATSAVNSIVTSCRLIKSDKSVSLKTAKKNSKLFLLTLFLNYFELYFR